ncbi:helix-turn-helix transcriptional regulator [Nonomuraea sp. NPDC002799]
MTQHTKADAAASQQPINSASSPSLAMPAGQVGWGAPMPPPHNSSINVRRFLEGSMKDQARTTDTDAEEPQGPAMPEAAGMASQPLVVGLMEASQLLGMGRTTAYRLAKTGMFPCPVLRFGGRYAVPLHGLRALLGYVDRQDSESLGHDPEG